MRELESWSRSRPFFHGCGSSQKGRLRLHNTVAKRTFSTKSYGSFGQFLTCCTHWTQTKLHLCQGLLFVAWKDECNCGGGVVQMSLGLSSPATTNTSSSNQMEERPENQVNNPSFRLFLFTLGWNFSCVVKIKFNLLIIVSFFIDTWCRLFWQVKICLKINTGTYLFT